MKFALPATNVLSATLATVCCAATLTLAAAGPDSSFEMYAVRATSSVTIRLKTAPGECRILFLDATGKWQDAACEKDGDARVIHLDAARVKDGSTMLLINPPESMNFNDQAAPEVRELAVDGRAATPQQVTDLGGAGTQPREIRVTLHDESPIRSDSVCVTLDQKRLGPDRLEVRIDKGSATCTARLPDVAFGGHEVVFRVADASPFRNSTEVKVGFAFVDTKNVAQAELGAKVKVDSCFPNYSPDALIDGDWQTCAGAGGSDVTWASAETGSDHWIEVTLPKPESIDSVALYWAYKKPSKKVEAQVQKDGKWTCVGVAERAAAEQACTLIRFDPVRTDRIRVFQPAGHGREDRPNLAWVGEISVRKSD